MALLAAAVLAVVVLSRALSLRAAATGSNSAPADTPSERKPVPDFTVNTLEGATWSLADHKGKVVLVNLFATWCPPCRAEMPGLVEMIHTYRPQGVEALALSLDQGGADVVRPFVAKYKMDFPVALPGPETSVANGVSAIPVTLLIDRNGRLAQAYMGMVSEPDLKRDLDRLLQEKE